MTPLRRLLPLIACLVTLALTWTMAFVLWPTLPDRIPLHFDFAGRPDRAGDRTWFNWLLGPIVVSALSILLAGTSAGIVRLARTRPAWINVPDAARFRALQPDERVRVLAPLIGVLSLAPALINLLAIYLLAGTQAVAVGRWQRLPATPLIVVVAAVLATVVVGALQVRRLIREASARRG